MRTIEIQAYKFNELDEQAKQKAIENNIYINVDYDWWEDIYREMEECGIKIKSFDLGRSRSCSIEFIDDAQDVAEKILKEWGHHSAFYSDDCKQFLKDRDDLVKKYGTGNDVDGYKVDEDKEDEFDQDLDDLYYYFRNDMQQNILHVLDDGYIYLTSEETITDTIEANEYEFTKDGSNI